MAHNKVDEMIARWKIEKEIIKWLELLFNSRDILLHFYRGQVHDLKSYIGSYTSVVVQVKSL